MTLSVFLVEDDPVLKHQLTDLINTGCGGHVVATAESEEGATNWLAHHADDCQLVVLDLFLKDGTGFGVLASLSGAVGREHVIVLTNSATAEHRSRCLALGARAVYDKTTELTAFLEHCLRHKRQLR